MFDIGARVQMHPATDAWMRGERYGTIVKVTRAYWHVKLDASKRITRVPRQPSELALIIPA